MRAAVVVFSFVAAIAPIAAVANDISIDAKGRPLTQYVGSYVQVGAGRREWLDVDYRRGNLYLSTHNANGTECWVARPDFAGLSMVIGYPEDYATMHSLLRAFSTDVFWEASIEPNGIKIVDPQMGCNNCDHLYHYKRVAVRPEPDHMWRMSEEGEKLSCLPKK